MTEFISATVAIATVIFLAWSFTSANRDLREAKVATSATPTRSAYSDEAEAISEHRMLKSDRQYRKDYRNAAASDTAARNVFSKLLSVPEVASVFRDTETPKLRIVGNHSLNGTTVAASVKWDSDGVPTLTVSRKYMTPTAMLHELAHHATGLAGGHGPSWAILYGRFVRAAYPGRASQAFKVTS